MAARDGIAHSIRTLVIHIVVAASPASSVGRNFLSARQEGPGVHSSSNWIVNSVVEMRRRVTRVSGVAYVSQDVARIHEVSRLEAAVTIEMRVVMHLPPRTEDIHYLSAELVGSDARDDPFG